MIDEKTAEMFKFMNQKGDGMKKVNGIPMMADGKTPDVRRIFEKKMKKNDFFWKNANFLGSLKKLRRFLTSLNLLLLRII